MAAAGLLGRVVQDAELATGAEELLAQPERVGHAAADRVPDALGKACGPARIRQEDILLAAAHPGRRLGRSDQLLIAARARQPNSARTFADLDDQANPGGLVADRRHPLAQRRVEEERLGLAVLQQRPQLGAAVAVVHVGGHARGFQGGEERLEVLRAVVEVAGDDAARAEAAGRSAPASRAARSSNSPHPMVRVPWVRAGAAGISSAMASHKVAKCSGSLPARNPDTAPPSLTQGFPYPVSLRQPGSIHTPPSVADRKLARQTPSARRQRCR